MRRSRMVEGASCARGLALAFLAWQERVESGLRSTPNKKGRRIAPTALFNRMLRLAQPTISSG